ncbi:hypothetical protein AGMMS4957_02780 [Bacteroidia bacterium]|nr:hypothetical protein AGMMS4957_02780 [Bacteroidia bacterium]
MYKFPGKKSQFKIFLYLCEINTNKKNGDSTDYTQKFGATVWGECPRQSRADSED